MKKYHYLIIICKKKRFLIKLIPDFILRGSISGMENTHSLRLGHKEKIFVRVGGKVLLFEIYQQDIVLSENKVGLSTRVQGPYFPPRKTIVITRIRNTTSLIFKFGSKRR